ncbi:hypothetical protein TrST_g1979 [Triparma strigata]|nr:hypothetical protein TrST_g1979 [Triparma strigata]
MMQKLTPKSITPPKSSFFARPKFGNPLAQVGQGLRSMGTKIGVVKKKSPKYSYKKEAEKAREVWKGAREEEVVRAFVKGCIVFASIKVIEKERKRHIGAFGERKQWSSKRGYFYAETLDPKVEIMKSNVVEDVSDDPNPASTPPVSEDSKSDGGDVNSDDDFDNLVVPMQSTHSVSINELYGDNTLSPIQMYSTHSDSKPKAGPVEGQENFWKVIGRVFRAAPSKEVEKEEIAVEEEIKKVAKVYVEPRIKYQWQERITWLDEIIKMANDNYGGSDGGFARDIPSLVSKSTQRRADAKDSQKRGEPWSKKRLQSAIEFEKTIFDPDETLESVKSKLFKTGTDA